MKKSKKGFTLIELLAVIIILGVLMLIAIPSVTEYINNSRRSSFLASASSFISGVTVKVNAGADGGLSFSDPDVAYYVPVSDVAADSCINLEKGGKSPFGDWVSAYVIVVLNPTGTAYSYYFTAIDDADYGMLPLKEGSWAKTDIVASSPVTFPADGATITAASNTFEGITRDLTVELVDVATCN